MYIILAQVNQAQLLARCTIEDLFLEWLLKVGQAKLAKDIWKCWISESGDIKII